MYLVEEIPLHSPCGQKMDKGKIALTPNVEQSGMLGSAFEQNAGSIPALAMRPRVEKGEKLFYGIPRYEVHIGINK